MDFGYSWTARWQPRKDGWYLITTKYIGRKNGDNRENTTMTLQTFIGNPEHIKGVHVDHINHNSLDNRKENLRIVNKHQNARNRKSKNRNNKTGYRNVMFLKRNKKRPYIVQMMIDGENKRIGAFADVHEAGKFAEKMRYVYYGEFAGRS